jgi:hypothetical protein
MSYCLIHPVLFGPRLLTVLGPQEYPNAVLAACDACFVGGAFVAPAPRGWFMLWLERQTTREN